jgi:hypothetical protein
VSSVVHLKLLGICALPVTLAAPLDTLAKQFGISLPSDGAFVLQNSRCGLFLSYFVPSLGHIPLWHEILLFLLKNDALVVLHLHFRIIVIGDIKQSVYVTAQDRGRRLRAALQRGFEERGQKRASLNWTRTQPGGALYEDELTPVPQQALGYGVSRSSETELVARKGQELGLPEPKRGSAAKGVAWSEGGLRRSPNDGPPTLRVFKNTNRRV